MRTPFVALVELVELVEPVELVEAGAGPRGQAFPCRTGSGWTPTWRYCTRHERLPSSKTPPKKGAREGGLCRWWSIERFGGCVLDTATDARPGAAGLAASSSSHPASAIHTRGGRLRHACLGEYT